MSALQREPAKPGVPGLDALVAAVTKVVPRTTWLLPGPRETACALLRGASADRLHASRPYRVVPAGEEPSVRALMGLGLAIGGEPAVVFLGTGSLGYGSVLEAFQEAGRLSAPVCFVVGWYGKPGPFVAPTSPEKLAAAFGLKWKAAEVAEIGAVLPELLPGPSVLQVRLS